MVAVVEQWIETGWRRGDARAMAELLAPDFVDRSSAGRGMTRKDFAESVVALYLAFPDFSTEIDELVIDPIAGKVAVRWTSTGTHQGAYLGAAPTGKQITFHGIEIVRVEDGKIVERSGEWDGIAILEQLGVLP